MWLWLAMGAALISVGTLVRLLLFVAQERVWGLRRELHSRRMGDVICDWWQWCWSKRGLDVSVQWLGAFLYSKLSWRMRQRFVRMIVQAGRVASLSPEKLIGTQGFWAGVSLGFYILFVLGFGFDFNLGTHLFLGTVFTLVAGIYPCLGVLDQARSRQQQIMRQLPFMLDMLSLCVTAGMTLQGALQQASVRAPRGALRDELQDTLNDMRTGMVRVQALQALAQRVAVPRISAVVSALVQAEKLGMSLAPVLKAQAKQCRQDRFLAAETQAQQAPVKMLLPLVLCIFPCTFLVLSLPIAVRLWQGVG